MVADVVEVAEDFPATAVDKQFVIVAQGRQHVLYTGLVDVLHQLSSGFFSIDTRLEQLPTADNGQVAVCSARVQVYDPGQPDVVRRSATGIGDASPANVSSRMATATIRMAETRAKARALRDLLNVAMVAVEELGEPEPTTPAPRPEPPLERIEVEGRAYTRPEVLAGYRRRLLEARNAGLVLPPGTMVKEDAPLPDIMGAIQLLKRALEGARDAARSVASK